MKDTSKTLSHYGINKNSKIMMLGDCELKIADPQDSTLDILDSHFKSAEKIYKEFNPSLPECKEQYDIALRVGEGLLQILLKIDGVQCEAEWDKVRARRKKIVTDIQSLLDNIDGAKTSLKGKSKH